MIYYLIINLLIIAVGLFVPEKIKLRFSPTRGEKTIPLQCILLFVILFVFLGFRGDFTSDYSNYSSYFVRIYEDVSFKDIFSRTFSLETGFVFISKLIGCVTHSELAYHAILSFGMLVLFFRVFNAKSKLLWISILLFVNLGDYFGAMNLFRQALAAAIVFSGFELIVQKKYLKFLVLVALATTIHTTALVMVIFYFALISNRNAIGNIFVVLIFIATWFLVPFIVNVTGAIFPKYFDYHYGMGQGSINAIIAVAMIYLFAEISIRFFVKDYQRNDPLNMLLMNGTLLCVFFLALGMKVYMFTRLAYFFRPFACLLVPNILSFYPDKKTKAIVTSIIAVFCILYTQVTLSGTGYDPYYFYSGAI